MVRAKASGTIAFGLVSIPVQLYTAATKQRVEFNMIHPKCGGRMEQKMWCPVDQEYVERADMIRGWENLPDQYVLFTEAELQSLKGPRSTAIELVEFVPEDTLDIMYLESTDYVGPGKGGEKAYRLLIDAMRRTKRVAVGRYTPQGKEEVVILRPYGERGLQMHTMFFEREVREFEWGTIANDFAPAELEGAERLIDAMSSDRFSAAGYSDSYQTRVREAIEAKKGNLPIPEEAPAKHGQIVNILEALKASVAEAAAKKAKPGPKKAAPPAEEESPKKAKGKK